MVKLTPEACRAARGLLRWSAADLAEAAGTTGQTIVQFENGRPMRETNAAKIIATFEQQGIEILNGDNPGARIASAPKRPPKKPPRKR